MFPRTEFRVALCYKPVVVAAALLTVSATAADVNSLTYPTTRKVDVLDDYHGTKVPDPYRWLEDDNSDETAAWVEAQNKVTFGFLEKIPQRPKIRSRLKELWNYERFGVPHQEGGRYFFTHNSGLQNQAVLLVADKLDVEPRLLLDPNALSPDGTVSLTGWAVSDDGKLLAYSLSRSGADWQEWHVRDVETAKDRGDIIKWSKFSGASWARDGSGFYYSRFDEPRQGQERKGVVEFQKLYFHRLGTPQSEDSLIYERRDQKEWGFHGDVTDDGRYLIITVTRGTDPKNAIFYRDLQKPGSPVVELLRSFNADYGFIDNQGPIFFFQTDLEAPRKRVIAINVDTAGPDLEPEHPKSPPKPPPPGEGTRSSASTPANSTGPRRWTEVISESKDTLENTSSVGEKLICSYLQDAHNVVRLFASPDGASPARQIREISLPSLGSVEGFTGKRRDKETFYQFTSFTTPRTVYRLDLESDESSVLKAPKVSFDSAPYETRQVFATSKDGTRVPMFITQKRGLTPDGKQPVLLYGYGGFEFSLTPSFNVRNVVWLELGGVYVEANLRGGGEYGSLWHKAGIKENKQNVFDDFIACAEWLVANGYTSPQKLAINGGSNGGLLVGACMTQRPELFGAALPAVGVLDMLRFHKFTIGWAWTSDYGSADDRNEFKALYAYSPLHNLERGTRYPATMISTADHDDRVVPAHSFKFAAQLQESQAKDGPPVLIRIETKAGHGAGTALNKVIDETADELAFLVKVLGME